MIEKNNINFDTISTNQLVQIIKDGNSSKRFCFIIGAGASVSSGISTGVTLEERWMKDIEENLGFENISSIAKELKKRNQLEYDFEEIKESWEKSKNLGIPLPSKFYFDIYTLRFYPDNQTGHSYLENEISNKIPSFGYHTLALMLTNNNGRHNLVITTNFDNLVEYSLFMYTNSNPLVINHELLADFASNPNINCPIIAKVHRGMHFEPLNTQEETNNLREKWVDVLKSVFKIYTPIVIGYGGGDRSLMEFLEREEVEFKNKIYWCYFQGHEVPNERIQKLIQNKKGYFVDTAGFDAIMLAIGNALFPNEIGVYQTELYLKQKANKYIENYSNKYEELVKSKQDNSETKTTGETDSSIEFQKEKQDLKTREDNLERKRQQLNKMTEWDYWRKGNQYIGLKEYNKAIECYSKAINNNQNAALFYHNRGCAYNGLKKYEEAISDFNKAIELKLGGSEVYYNRGSSYSHLGKYEEAISDFNRAIEFNPDDSNAYNGLGSCYEFLGEYKEAISNFSKAIEFNLNEPDNYYNRGCSYIYLGKYEEAISDFNKVIELNPNKSEAYHERGCTYNALRKYEEAISDFNRAIELNPDEPKAYYNRGCNYSALDKHNKAILDYSKAIELNPNELDAYYNRYLTYKCLGESAKAASDYDKFNKLKRKLLLERVNTNCNKSENVF